MWEATTESQAKSSAKSVTLTIKYLERRERSVGKTDQRSPWDLDNIIADSYWSLTLHQVVHDKCCTCTISFNPHQDCMRVFSPCFTADKNWGPWLSDPPKSLQLLDGETEIWTQFVRPQSPNSSQTKLYQTLGWELGQIRQAQTGPRVKTGVGAKHTHRERQTERKQVEI